MIRGPAVVFALVLASGCKKQEDKPAAPPPQIPMTELRRGQDACKTYVEKVCKCAETVEAATERCKLSRAYPDAIDVAMMTVGNTRSKSDEVKNAAESVRKTMATCIEETARLPTIGCPP